MALLGHFAALVLCLAALGTYGAVPYPVGRRSGETGIRIALAVRPGQVVRLVVVGAAPFTVSVVASLSLVAGIRRGPCPLGLRLTRIFI
jgi:hypothetical protein